MTFCWISPLTMGLTWHIGKSSTEFWRDVDNEYPELGKYLMNFYQLDLLICVKWPLTYIKSKQRNGINVKNSLVTDVIELLLLSSK